MFVDLIAEKYAKIIAWGAGKYFERYYNLLEGKIAYIVDRCEDLHGKMREGIEINSPYELEKECNKEKCLIVVFSAAFDEIVDKAKSLGKFDIIDIRTIELLYSLSLDSDINGMEYESRDIEKSILVCAGLQALWTVNGEKKFIDTQNEIIRKKGFWTIEAAPIPRYYQKCNVSILYFITRVDGRNIEIISLADFIDKYRIIKSMIIHSLYYCHEVLEVLLSNIEVRNSVLYYIHDYYCICHNRFLVLREKECLGQDLQLNCDFCENRESQKEIYDFHNNLFSRYGVKLVAPSQYAARVIKKIYQHNEVIVIPHLNYRKEFYFKEWKKAERIAYIGNASRMKGWDDFKDIYLKLNKKYDFYCLGECNVNDRIEGIKYIEVSIKKETEAIDMVSALIENRIDIVYMGALCPESFSYTYYEAYEAGCFVITNIRNGNICNQVRINQNGIIIESIEEAIQWLENTANVSDIVTKMNRKIVDVRADETFLKYL